MKSKSQCKIIADYLKAGNSIDSSTAYRICGTMCLAQRIANLRKAPFHMDIDVKTVVQGSRHYAVYSLKTELDKKSFWQKSYSNVGIL